MSKNCSELTCDSPRACRFYNHSPSLSPSHSPRSPSHSPFILTLLHSMQRQPGPKIGGAPTVPSFDAFFDFRPLSRPPRSDRLSLPDDGVQNPLPALSGCQLSSSSSRMRAPSYDDPAIVIIATLPPRIHRLLSLHHRHGPAEPAGAHGGRTAACSC